MRNVALALFLVASTAVATPARETPRWYVAHVRTLTVQGGHARLLPGELYGPFRTAKTAAAFCASVPATAARCDVVPVLAKSEWLRKGAR